MNERGRFRSSVRRDGGDRKLICPKPRRLAFGGCSTTDILKPAPNLRSQGSVASEGDAGGELLDILLYKQVGLGDSNSLCSSLPHFCGSPPSRASNPLIRDVQFSQKRVPSLPLVLPSNSSPGSPFGANLSLKKSSCSASYAANPSVRVEGFVSTTSDSHRGVPALA
eukprot:c22665_g1_i2 orf=361-861(+)